MPSPQPRHDACPADPWYLPGLHWEQPTLPSSSDECVPALQVEQIMAACALLYLPCWQAGHVLWPVEPCDVPGAQAVQATAAVAAATLPALHATHAGALGVGACEPLAHAVQLPAPGREA